VAFIIKLVRMLVLTQITSVIRQTRWTDRKMTVSLNKPLSGLQNNETGKRLSKQYSKRFDDRCGQHLSGFTFHRANGKSAKGFFAEK